MVEPLLIVKLENADRTLRPDGMSVRDLARVATLLEDSLTAAAVGEASEHAGEVLVSLTGVEPGSAKLRLTLAASVLGAAVAMKSALITSQYRQLNPTCQNRLHELWKFLVGRSWHARLIGLGRGEVVLDDAHAVPKVARTLLREVTTVYGECVTAGGVEPQAKVRLLNTRRLLTVAVGDELAKALGGRLYDIVGIRGTAMVDAATREIDSFRGEALVPYRGRAARPADALDQLAVLTAKHLAAGSYTRDGEDEE